MSGAGDFEPAFAAALTLAEASPSSHNSQPWALAVGAPAVLGLDGPAGSRALVVCLDEDRKLRTLAAHTLEMNLSCGMYLQALLLALRQQGFSGRLAWRIGDAPRPKFGADLPATWTPLAVAIVAPGKPDDDVTDRVAALPARRTNRAPYAEGALAAADVAPLCAGEVAAEGPVGEPLAVTIFDQPGDVKALGRFVARHAAADFAHAAAWRETHAYIRHDPANAVDGFPLTQLFGPLSWARTWFFRIALHPVTMGVLKWFGYPRIIAGEFGALVAGSPASVAFALTDPKAGDADQLLAGARLLDAWLRLTAAGFAMHPVSVVLQHDDIRTKLQSEFNLAGRVVFFARLGRPVAAFPPTPRRGAANARVARLGG
ncbi:MAG: hypothetical protein KC620_03050 [Myxococcales bacterium]|nr:hypothetical protein [Myxococcales bacterium]